MFRSRRRLFELYTRFGILKRKPKLTLKQIFSTVDIQVAELTLFIETRVCLLTEILVRKNFRKHWQLRFIFCSYARKS